MSLTVQVSIGRKYAIYLPKSIVKALNLKEGGKVLLRLSETSVILESLQDPVRLALSGKKFASVTPDQVEKISGQEQASHLEDSA